MRRRVLALAVVAALASLAGCSTSGPRVWTSTNTGRLTADPSYGITFNWAGVTVANITGYFVTENGTQEADVGSTATSYHFTDLACSTTYTLGVQAHDASTGHSSVYSEDYTTPDCPPEFPLQVSGNGRYLENALGDPFLVVGDSPQSVAGNLSLTNAAAYFTDRETQGFNASWVNVLCTDYTSCLSSGDGWNNTAGTQTLAPFTSGSTPSNYLFGSGECGDCNATYFGNVHTMVADAEADGIEVFLDPVPTDNCNSGDWTDMLTNASNGDGTLSTTDGDYRYGEYLGTEFGDLSNIVWMSGNDFNCISTTATNNDTRSVANGIAATDPTALQTLESNDCFGNGCNGSTSITTTTGDATNWSGQVQINEAYTYAPTFAEVRTAYGQSPTMPTILGEANYEGQALADADGCGTAASDPTTRFCRLQEWWTMTSGASGQLYSGNYQSGNGTANDGAYGIQNGFTDGDIDTVGSAQLDAQATFLRTIDWWTLAPDTGHALVTSGYESGSDCSPTSGGTFGTNTCVTDAADSFTDGDATLALVYLPDPSTFESPVVDLAKFAGSVTATWVDPADGAEMPVSGSPFTATGTHTFTPSSNNSEGDKDWALLLQAS